MSRSMLILSILLIISCHVAFARPASPFAYAETMDQPLRTVWKRADNPQELVMARLQALLGPEAFTEIDSHGRLSNLQRLG